MGRELERPLTSADPEIAARVKRADLSFKFAMEIRNKLIDAYREVMRMQV